MKPPAMLWMVGVMPGGLVPQAGQPEYVSCTTLVLLRSEAATGIADPAIPKVSDNAIRVNVNSDKQDLVLIFASGVDCDYVEVRFGDLGFHGDLLVVIRLWRRSELRSSPVALRSSRSPRGTESEIRFKFVPSVR